MHNAKCNSIAVDGAGRYLLTCSDDRTARLWDAASGDLLKILRVPIGKTDEGKLNGCALSPDGKTIAVGGFTGSWENADCIYIIDAATSQILKVLRNLPNVINRLEFSKDGKWLAAGLGAGGVWVYDTGTWVAKQLTGYNDQVYGLSFSDNGLLATACFDNFIRIYQLPDFSLVTSKQTTTGQLPFSICFNPAGDLIAVGYEKPAMVEVFNSSNLQSAYLPDVTGIPTNQEISSIAFSEDGNFLYAGGSYRINNAAIKKKYVLRKWDAAGRSAYTDLPLLSNSVMTVKPVPKYGMVLLGSNPDMALINEAGDLKWYKDADNLDFAQVDPSRFKISDDGTAINMITNFGELISFSISGRSMYQNNFNYAAPALSRNDVSVTSWKNSPTPSINNKRVGFLVQNEICRSACVNYNGSSIVWGGDWNLYLTDNSGSLKWQTPLPERAFAVNMSANGKIVCAMLGDGTVRWYNSETGKELLIFFLNGDKQRWTLFTPQGYYDASAGGEDLLGWHVNTGNETAPAFFPASRFKSFYYRPDIITALSQTWDADAAVKSSNQSGHKRSEAKSINSQTLPPVVVVSSPFNGGVINNNKVNVTYTINGPNDVPVKNIIIQVNNRPAITNTKPIYTAGQNAQQTVEVTVPEAYANEDCAITLIAENKYGTGPETTIHLKYAGAGKNNTGVARKKPSLYLLSVGVSQYSNSGLRLAYAANDANAFTDFFTRQKGLMYGEVTIKTFTDNQATQKNILVGLNWLEQNTMPGDVAIIFFSGHGVVDNSNGYYYIAPFDADDNNLSMTCLGFESLRRTVSSIAGKVVVFIDACHSGKVTASSKYNADLSGAVNDLANDVTGAVVFSSSTGKEVSKEDNDSRHGAFTKAVLDGLNGGAMINKNKQITFKALDLFISEEVPKRTANEQHPVTTPAPNVYNFAIAAQP